MIRALALFALLAAACNQNAAPTSAMPGMTAMPGVVGMPSSAAIPAMPATVAMPATAAVAAEPTSAELPVPEDFEEEARTTVQTANFRSELDRITAEVEASP